MNVSHAVAQSNWLGTYGLLKRTVLAFTRSCTNWPHSSSGVQEGVKVLQVVTAFHLPEGLVLKAMELHVILEL